MGFYYSLKFLTINEEVVSLLPNVFYLCFVSYMIFFKCASIQYNEGGWLLYKNNLN